MSAPSPLSNPNKHYIEYNITISSPILIPQTAGAISPVII
jgi:hypothetical protein